MTKLFVSDEILGERLVTTPPEPHEDLWGWKKLSALYQASFSSCGFQITPVLRPEIYHADVARAILGIEPGDWHLSVKPLEHLRPFHQLPNAFVCNWPFPELGTSSYGESPFYDHTRLLRVANAVLCCTDYTTQTLHRAGIESAVTLPPVILPAPERGPRDDRRGPTQFLSVIEYTDLDRQLVSLVEGFFEAARYSNVRLTLCLQGGGNQGLADLKQRVARTHATCAPGQDECIAVIAPMPGASATLYEAADFFLCTHTAPGLFLPLAEAMLTGLPLVTTLTGGTASLLTHEAVVPIETERCALAASEEPIARHISLTAHAPTPHAVQNAISSAAGLDQSAKKRLGKAARDSAEARFGAAAFKSGVRQLDTVFRSDKS